MPGHPPAARSIARLAVRLARENPLWADRRLDSPANPQPRPPLDEWFEDFRFLIRDRGSNFTRSFDAVFQAASATILSTAVQAPRMNAICERLIGTLRHELPDRSLILGEAHLRAVLAEYQEHYNTARPHQGINQRVPDTEHHPPRITAGDFPTRQIRRKPVLSGLINEDVRAA